MSMSVFQSASGMAWRWCRAFAASSLSQNLRRIAPIPSDSLRCDGLPQRLCPDGGRIYRLDSGHQPFLRADVSHRPIVIVPDHWQCG